MVLYKRMAFQLFVFDQS